MDNNFISDCFSAMNDEKIALHTQDVTIGAEADSVEVEVFQLHMIQQDSPFHWKKPHNRKNNFSKNTQNIIMQTQLVDRA